MKAHLITTTILLMLIALVVFLMSHSPLYSIGLLLLGTLGWLYVAIYIAITDIFRYIN